MVIKTDEDAQDIIGNQIYVISENKIMPMVVTDVIITKRFSGINATEVDAVVKTALGEYKSEDVFANKEEFIKYLDRVIEY